MYVIDTGIVNSLIENLHVKPFYSSCSAYVCFSAFVSIIWNISMKECHYTINVDVNKKIECINFYTS